MNERHVSALSGREARRDKRLRFIGEAFEYASLAALASYLLVGSYLPGFLELLELSSSRPLVAVVLWILWARTILPLLYALSMMGMNFYLELGRLRRYLSEIFMQTD